MRRFITGLLTAALLTVPLAAPVAAGDHRCTKGNVRGYAEGTVALAKQVSERGATKGTAASLTNCVFVLYDNNGPVDTHVFSDDEWFLGGIWNWITDDVIDEDFGGSRKAAADAIASFEGHTLEWREINPDSAWTVLPLTKTSVKATNSTFFEEVFPVIRHWYHIFKPGSVDPGQYEWKWTFDAPWNPAPEVVVGRVDIVAG